MIGTAQTPGPGGAFPGTRSALMQSKTIHGIELVAPSSCAQSCFHTAAHVVRTDEYQIGPIVRAKHTVAHVIDVGANIGIFGACVRRHWPLCKVLAWEPVAEVAECCRLNVPGAEVRVAAAWSADGELRIDILPELTIGSSIHESWRSGDWFTEQRTVRAERVSTRIPQDWPFDIDILKIDCEGSEVRILDELRASGTLQRIRWIRGEWHGKPNKDACRQVFESAGTHVYKFDAGDGRVGPFIAHRGQRTGCCH